MMDNARHGERIYRGSAVSGGVSQGHIFVVARQEGTFPRRDISASEVEGEIDRFRHALGQTHRQVLEVQNQVASALSAQDASIFEAHLLALEDPTLIDEVTRSIRGDRVNAEHAYHEVSERYARTLDAMEDDYLRERAADMRDVASRVLNNLLGRDRKFAPSRLTEPCILVSDDLSPSDTAVLDKKIVLGFATHGGSRTSHSAIMARALQIPAVVGLQNAAEGLVTGEYALLDGYNGLLVVNPTDQTLFEYGQLVQKRVHLEEKLRNVMDKPAVTLDGKCFTLLANIEKPSDADGVVQCGAEGVGLFRTEYLFLQRESRPSEEEQFEAYRAVATRLAPRPVVIRTLDLGGDKVWFEEHPHREANPFLGWRAIRLCLDEKALFRSQLRAILRASAHGNIRLLYPMICTPEELDAANALLEACKSELRAEGRPFNEAIEIGVMIEIPSAALMAGTLATKVKFFSIGTNDLTQYTLAVDRLNERIAHLYEPAHPAVLRLIQMTVEAARPLGVKVAVCGEMAGDPVMVPLLLGLGVEELSASPSLIAPVKFLIRRLKMEEARKLASAALLSASADEVLERSRALAREIAPSLFENQI